MSLSICHSLWLCVSVCVSLQEAELAARILLDQGQVTVGQCQGGRMCSSLSSRYCEGPSLALWTFSPFPTFLFSSLLSHLQAVIISCPPTQFCCQPFPKNPLILFLTNQSCLLLAFPPFENLQCVFSLMVTFLLTDSLCGDALWLCHLYRVWHPQTQTPSNLHLP